jgi:hypothetical protein
MKKEVGIAPSTSEFEIKNHVNELISELQKNRERKTSKDE